MLYSMNESMFSVLIFLSVFFDSDTFVKDFEVFFQRFYLSDESLNPSC